jgi:hypothetical protein
MLVALIAIAAEQGTPTENTLRRVYQFLDYAATHPEAVVTYKASNMVLAIHSDASYLSEPKSRSRAGGRAFFPFQKWIKPPEQWGSIECCKSHQGSHVLGGRSQTRRTIHQCKNRSSDAQNARRTQPPTTTDSTAYGVINNKIQPKATKAMDM